MPVVTKDLKDLYRISEEIRLYLGNLLTFTSMFLRTAIPNLAFPHHCGTAPVGKKGKL